MQAPAITRYRRPFLAPLWLSVFGAALLAGVAFSAYRAADTTVVVLVRPAQEKEPAVITDPPITPEGEERAQRLARMFGEAPAGLDGLYASQDRLAEQTVAPLAERLHRAPVVFASADSAAIAARLAREPSGGTALVVADGSAFRQLLQSLAGTEVPQPPEEGALLYIVSIPTFGRAHLLRMRL